MADLDGQLSIDVIINEVDIFAGYLTEEKLQEAIIDWSTLDDETKATEIESYK